MYQQTAADGASGCVMVPAKTLRACLAINDFRMYSCALEFCALLLLSFATYCKEAGGRRPDSRQWQSQHTRCRCRICGRRAANDTADTIERWYKALPSFQLSPWKPCWLAALQLSSRSRRRHCEADAHGGEEIRTDRQGQGKLMESEQLCFRVALPASHWSMGQEGLAEDHAQVGRDDECGGLLSERAATPDDASSSGWLGDVSKVIGKLLGRKAAEVSTLLLHFRSGPPEDSVSRKRPKDHPGLLDIFAWVDDFEKLFDAISRVTFDKIDRRKIKEIKSVAGNSDERVILQAPVMAQGNIEDWLQNLEAEMQRSVRRECRLAAGECGFGLEILQLMFSAKHD
eukprot:s5173_g2.t1